jgi:hypothetical protein
MLYVSLMKHYIDNTDRIWEAIEKGKDISKIKGKRIKSNIELEEKVKLERSKAANSVKSPKS